ncbi:MAG: hypothetical protein MUF21_09275 [Gemmatimonadaceae bacterium]|jgi:hypothetical protein|nr:hypothetical protein [Gemmatimonadaceae bacterium]
MRLVRLAITLALAAYGAVLLMEVTPWAVVDHVNLAIHEAGHIVFLPFGDTMHWLGGTLLQLLVPLVFCIYFWRAADEHGASVALWWVGENCWNIALYIRDAEAMELPLVGGGEHDWNTLLTAWGVMDRYVQIADTVRMTGTALFALSIMWGLAALWRGPTSVAAPRMLRPAPGAAARRR